MAKVGLYMGDDDPRRNDELRGRVMGEGLNDPPQGEVVQPMFTTHRPPPRTWLGRLMQGFGEAEEQRRIGGAEAHAAGELARDAGSSRVQAQAAVNRAGVKAFVEQVRVYFADGMGKLGLIAQKNKSDQTQECYAIGADGHRSIDADDRLTDEEKASLHKLIDGYRDETAEAISTDAALREADLSRGAN